MPDPLQKYRTMRRFDETPEPSGGKPKLGKLEPKDGQIILRVEVVGANAKAKGSKSYFGLDAVTLAPP